MNKATIIEKIRGLNFNVNEFWVIAGAALVLHGLREETADIDLACTKRLFSTLLLQGYSVERNELGYRKFVWKKTLKFLTNGMLRVSYLLMIFLQQVWKDSKK